MTRVSTLMQEDLVDEYRLLVYPGDDGACRVIALSS